ncbi:DUF72 domain-containing protein [Desulfofundulus thermosubterraneus]|uniref:Uncharacterized protein n=1 Tax=Desulfofundulus thermosubterraneus DSM 16057 TaxID=1121432 RepID=A0A1M6GXP7_9FIRM|nr:Protein of unknown function DUF72 [Desulfofundulus thermosubterraneus DSM 16057]
MNTRRFVYALEPLLSAGKLGAVLLQFPYSLHNTQENRCYLARLNTLKFIVPVAVELRYYT